MRHCQAPTHESHLTGSLLGEISARCDAWAKVAAAPLGRLATTLSLDRIDLTILGGEQKTGGDFGLVLEFDDRRTQSLAGLEPSVTRIVPLIFQAKRYVRPTADVSQRHPVHGFRHSLAKAVFAHSQGRIHDRSPEAQQKRVMALNLVIAAINCWNTLYMDKADGHLKRQGLLPEPELLRHLAPLGWLHVNLTGDYNWDAAADVLRTGFRPLNLAPMRMSA